MLRPSALLFLYRWRLSSHPLHELLAGAGIAVGVALLFAVQISNASLTGSVEQLVTAITGDATLELAARDDQGFDQRLLSAVRAIPGVTAAAPSLERRAVIRGPDGAKSIVVIGTDPSLATLGGTITQNFGPGRLLLPREGLVLPKGVADHVGTLPGEMLTLEAAGRARRVRVIAVLGSEQIGRLTASDVAVGPLSWVQGIVGTPGRISRAFVRTEPGDEARVERTLERMSAGRLNVGPADSIVRRMEGVTAPNDQSTALFAGISALVGLLLAFNAMLLTMPERRRFVVELRTQGFTPGQVVLTLLFQAVVLGLGAAVVGLVLGDLLSRALFGSIPTYLSFTFPVGTQRVVPLSAVLIAIAAGVGASVLAVARTFADLHPARSVDAVYEEDGNIGEGFSPGLRRRLLGAAVTLALVALVVAVALPVMTLLAVAALATAVLCSIPTVLAGLMRAIDGVARRLRQNMLVVALIGAQSTMTRSVAVAAIAAVAVFGTLTLGGAREDLIRGLFAGYADHLQTADLWVTTAGRSLTTDSFQLRALRLARLRGEPAVASARVYQGGMYDIGERRIWVIARSRDARRIVPPSQLLEGKLGSATARMRRGGWICLSTALARRYGVGVGDSVELPTPTGPRRFRVAAVTTNLSWGPGAMILNTSDYRRYWASSAPSALEIDLRPGVSAAEGRRAVERALGPGAGYDIETADELEAEFRTVLLEGLARLKQISILMIVSAALALSAALGASIWHRRQRLAAYKMQGFRRRQLQRILLLEALTILTLGSLVGAAAGVAGHLLCNRWLELTTGFPAPFSPQLWVAITSIAPIVLVATALVAVPGYLASKVPPGLRFSD